MGRRGNGGHPHPVSRSLPVLADKDGGQLSCACAPARQTVGFAFPLNFLANGAHVNQKISGRIRFGALALACMLLVACGTPPARDFKGAWIPVNRYRSAPIEIPLHRQYTFFAAPIDGTLKSMLGRWSNDTDRTLRYELGYDVTLYQPVATIRTTDLDAAAAELNTIYAAQGVRVMAKPGEILVQSTHRVLPPSTPPSTDDAAPKAAQP